jgi:acetyltransferase-like isoleucine patch superfamily enzyme
VKSVATQAVAYTTNHVVCRLPSYRLRRQWYQRLGVVMGPGSDIQMGCFLWFHGPGQLRRHPTRLGANTLVNRHCVLDLRASLTIGDNVSISAEAALITGSHDWRSPSFPARYVGITVEDHAFIGYRAVLLPGTVIGRGAVVAAGSVVHGTVPPLALVAGSPARVVGERPASALGYSLSDPRPLFE